MNDADRQPVDLLILCDNYNIVISSAAWRASPSFSHHNVILALF
ncbi:hypothetical protein EPIR_3026 [Erwinia piriflorinigrans CFBP 5888]|uniref:Uncharacterized protein n=1 Tax=Erwinia piriflorinigrans CFBP 5888 TaxID=1161919 RepID=V5ZBU0_9GAMM|nr:hypothetical protein EPIR_3026 [Erwinia piriflorinigrans CFBP 5888]